MENSVENASQTDAEIADNLVTWVFNDGFVPYAVSSKEVLVEEHVPVNKITKICK
ncbi:hypothetical protein [Lysinibacillus sphaericus]|uniref:hypothetical protein n=1 Tax=Lysinibacillus sphaericus TaxID=1421 RepID=UPI003D7F6B8D